MGILTFDIERWFASRHVDRILAQIEHSPELAAGYDPEVSAIYRVPLPDAPTIRVRTDEAEGSHTLHRGWGELFHLGLRLYLVDFAPMAMFGKPSAVVAFQGLRSEPVLFVWTQGPVTINDGPFPHFAGTRLQGLAVAGAANLNVWATPRPGIGQPVQATVLAGPFPGTDQPHPQPGTSRPTPSSGTTPGQGTFLFYGLCFRKAHAQTLIGGFAWGEPDLDPLWAQTQTVATAFRRRGYTTATGLAGDHTPAGSGSADTFDGMAAGLASHLGTQSAYCNSADDQLVLFVAAHGWGSSNGTGDVAMRYDPDGTVEFVSYARFFDALAGIPKIAANPSKVTLIMYSCRSGRVFEGGVLPSALRGMNVITASSSSDKLAAVGGISTDLPEALDRGAATWTDLVRYLKWGRANRTGDSYGRPRNGTLNGCRLQVTLRDVTYNSDDVGSDWKYRIRIDAYSTSPGGTQRWIRGNRTDVPEHSVQHLAVDTQGVKVYDRIWGVCASTNSVHLRPRLKATEVDTGPDDVGRARADWRIRCDGTDVVKVESVQVTEGGSTATMIFRFDMDTSCP